MTKNMQVGKLVSISCTCPKCEMCSSSEHMRFNARLHMSFNVQ